MKQLFLLFIVMACFKSFSQAYPGNQRKEEKGSVPRDHMIYDVLLSKGEFTLKEVDSLYRNDIVKRDTMHYYSNMKNFAFLILMREDIALDKNGTAAQKKFYIDEILSTDFTIAVQQQFYTLLLSCNDFMSKEELLNTGSTFFEKNKSDIEKVEWKKPGEEYDHMMSLNRLNREYLDNVVLIKN